jgi:hypothetical protein
MERPTSCAPKRAQLRYRILMWMQRLGASGMMQRDVGNPMGNAKTHVGAASAVR